MEQRQEGCQGKRGDKIDHSIPFIQVQCQAPRQNQQSTKMLQVFTVMKNLSDRKKLPEDVMQLQNKPTSAHRGILKTSKENHERKENAREDPTFDEYHSMKGKKKDDNGKPKSASESMRTNQLADLLAHVEAGMVDRLFWISVEESEGSGVLIGALLSYKILMCLFFFQSESGGLLLICTISHDLNEFEVE